MIHPVFSPAFSYLSPGCLNLCLAGIIPVGSVSWEGSHLRRLRDRKAAVRVPGLLLTLSMPVCSCVHRITTQDPVYGLIPRVQGLLVHSECSLVTCLCGSGRLRVAGALRVVVVLLYTPKHI